ncbi:hypothetical protein Tco_0450391 [Tanacetum coccineum]
MSLAAISTSLPCRSYDNVGLLCQEPLPVQHGLIMRVARLLAISSPPAHPLSPWSSVTSPECPFPLSPHLTCICPLPPPSPIHTLGYRDLPHAPPPMPTSAPTSFPPLLLPSTSHGEDRPEVNLPPWKRLGIALGLGYEVGESSIAAVARPAGGLRADYGFDEIVETLQGAPVSTDTELGAHVRDFESMVRRDTDEIYTMLDDEQSQRRLLAGRVNMLFRDRRGHAHTRLLMETEARMSREAWMSEITELQSADHNRRRAISDLLETDRERREEMRKLRVADRVGAALQGTGMHYRGSGYCILGTARTHWGSCTARAARGGW